MRKSRMTKPLLTLVSAMLVAAAGSAASVNSSEETDTRVRIAAANMKDALVVDCQLPGRLVQLGGARNYLTPGRLLRLAAVDCRERGGEYTVADLASGTLSLQRWLPLAEKGDPEAQYYVARIYANGIGGAPNDFGLAAQWYQKAATQKYAAAEQELGFLYEKGLGVPQDSLKALNLQRLASGLGNDLDFAWKITAAQDEAAKQAAALSEQLEASNAEIASLRAQASETSSALNAARGRQARAENAVLDLRAKLEAAKQAGGGADTGRIKDLESKLAENQRQLNTAIADLSKARADIGTQSEQLSARLAASQSTSSELNELLAAKQSETTELRARLAQSEQRLNRSQQELTDLRADFRSQVEQLSASREQLQQLKSRSNNDGGAALLAFKQRELDRQQLRVQSLESELAAVKAAMTKSASQSTATAATVAAANAAAAAAASKASGMQSQNSLLARQVSDLQERLNEQNRQLQVQKTELTSLRTQGQDQRHAALREMEEKLRAAAADLEGRQRRIASLESDAELLRGEVARYRDQRNQQDGAARGEAERAREALRMAQQKMAEQRDRLDQMRTDFAAQQASLVRDRESLELAMADAQRKKDREIESLKADIREREGILKARQERIALLERELSEKPTLVAANISYRQPAPLPRTLSVPGDANYYALVIGNNNYRYMTPLVTPANDAQTIADLLERQYAFKVKLMLDATSDEIMRTLHEYAIKLTENDRLLIYYAGHGGTQDGPPERAFWLGVDADPETQTGWLSAENVRAKIKQINARHIMLVADSCFAASITHPTTTTIGRSINERRLQVQWGRRARMVLTSGQNTPVVDSTGDRSHSLFAKYFIQVLRQNANVMSGEMLSYELGSRMQPEASRLGLKQSPTYSSLNDANHDFGDFFFVPATATRVAALSP